ncbi:unnamed protein product [Arabis nemorensis]|uniref:Uncharacterized protein n=1 Tax=Arabis nemorensis TaxID=586526 RepID=A0A565BGL6_9BRAS|nr:unnamed protein product [Arabis nemorensis]
MKSPISLKLHRVNLRRFLVRNFEIAGSNSGGDIVINGGDLDEPELLRRKTKSKLMTTTLILETIDATKCLCY